MSPLQDAEAQRWAERMQDTIATNSKVRDGLRDEAAIALVDWGATYAEHIAARMAAPDAPAPDTEQVENAGYTLTRLLTRLNWLVTYRRKKDAAWLTRTFEAVNALNRELYGEAAPAFSNEAIQAWIDQDDSRSEAEMVEDLIARLSPPDTPVSGDVPPDSPAPTEPRPDEPPAGPSASDAPPPAFWPTDRSPLGDFDE